MISRNWKSNYWKIDTGPKRQIMKRWSAVFLQILFLDFLRNMQLGLPLKKRFLAFVLQMHCLPLFIQPSQGFFTKRLWRMKIMLYYAKKHPKCNWSIGMVLCYLDTCFLQLWIVMSNHNGISIKAMPTIMYGVHIAIFPMFKKLKSTRS